MLEQRAWSVREREATERLHTLEQRLQAAQTADPSLTAAFEQFAQLDAHQGTRALARGWQRWGDWHRARGDVAAARTALARAYALSPTEAGRRDALAALTRLAREQGDWNGVGALLDQLGPQGVRQAGLGAVASEFAYVDFGGSDDTPLDAAPVLEALRTGVHTHLEGAPAFHWLPEPFVQRDDQLLPLDRSPQLTAASTQPWPLDALHDHALFWIGGESGLVAAGSAHNPGGVYQLTPEGPQQQLEWGASRLRAAWSGDLDDDGRTETFLAFGHYGRRLALLRQGADGWALTSPDPVLDASASAIQDLAVADLDGDGLRELVVATGTWGTADVRVYRLEGDALRLLARDKLGQTEEVAVLPRSDGTHAIVALRAFDWPMPKVFGGEAQSGAPLGLHVLTFDGARLQRLAHHPTAEANRLSVGDYDGDGLADLALTVDPSELHVFRQMPDGQLARGVFRGTALVNRGSPDLDGDGDAELLVRTAESGRIWVAGTGTTQLAHRTAPDVAPRVEPPPGLSAGLHQTWIRADELRILGMWQAAEEQLRSLAELAPDRDQQAAVLLQAATIAEEGADQQDVAALLRAADLYDRAAEHPDHFRDATLGAARCFEALLQTDDALARLQRLPRADPGRARISVLEGQRVEPIEVSLDPDAPGLQILEPLHARYLQGGGLALDLAAADTVVARLPVHWDGARFGVEVEIDADAVEWDSGVSVHLDSVDAPLPYPAPGLEFSGYGGAGHTRLAVTYGYRWSGYQQSDVPVGQRPQHIRARLDDFVSAIGYRVDLDGLQPEPMAWIKRFRDGEARPTGRYDLRLVSRGQRFRGRITALRIWGVTPQPLEPTTPVQAARDALATGRPADALAALRSVPPGVEREHLRIVALDDLDQGETLEAEVQRLLRRRSDAARAELARLLRIRGDRVGPILSRRLDHESWLRLFWKTFATVLHMHPESPAATDAATRVLGVVREDEVRDRQLAVDVLVARADAWRRLGRLAAASDHLERARVVAEELTGSRLATVHLERARLAMENGRTEHAMASLQAALASSPAPPLLADMIVADPVFAPLASRAEWDASVVAARRLSSSR
ncbi:MAG: VCBS repeat-containing protein [Myxococcales bacterium]|nr:VCBS repeat-containing protein [Myxococcales bacterium]